MNIYFDIITDLFFHIIWTGHSMRKEEAGFNVAAYEGYDRNLFSSCDSDGLPKHYDDTKDDVDLRMGNEEM